MRSKHVELIRAELTKVVEVMWSFGRSLRYTLRVFDGTGILVDDEEDNGRAGRYCSNREPMSVSVVSVSRRNFNSGLVVCLFLSSSTGAA